MGIYKKDLVSGMVLNPIQYKISNVTVTEGAVMIREATATNEGEVTTASTTAALNCLGCAQETATYSAAQAGPEGLVRLIPSPFSIWQFFVSGAAVASTAFPTAAPALILTNTLASAGGTVVTGNVGTVDDTGGLLKGRTGANAGVIRKIATHVDNTSEGVTVAFPNAIAVNDTFTRVPYSRAAIAMQLATLLIQANGIIAYGTGVPFDVTDVIIIALDDGLTDAAYVEGCFRTHLHNSLA